MKAEFEMVHGTVNVIQPHETNWINNSSTSVNPFPKPVSDLSQWVEHITKQLIDDLPETTTTETLHTAATSEDHYFIPSSHSGEFSPRKATRRSFGDDEASADRDHYELQWGNELQLHAEDSRRARELSNLDQHGLTLITLLFECAVAISVENPGEAHRMLLELTQMASPYGPSCAERVVAYFAKAMSSRVLNSWLGICSPMVNYKSIHSAFQVFNTISPFIKFAHFTSNQAILEAFHRRDRVHIIDLDIMQVN
jgi:hypothetical protein